MHTWHMTDDCVSKMVKVIEIYLFQLANMIIVN